MLVPKPVSPNLTPALRCWMGKTNGPQTKRSNGPWINCPGPWEHTVYLGQQENSRAANTVQRSVKSWWATGDVTSLPAVNTGSSYWSGKSIFARSSAISCVSLWSISMQPLESWMVKCVCVFLSGLGLYWPVAHFGWQVEWCKGIEKKGNQHLLRCVYRRSIF